MRRSIKMMDKTLFFSFLIMSLFGLFMIFSASYVKASIEDANSFKYLIRQGIIIAIGLVIYFITIRIPLSQYKKYIKLFLLAIIGLLVYLLIFGEEINGAKSWIELKIFNLQPSELAKSVLILYLAIYYHYKKATIKNYIDMLKPFFAVGIILLLVLLQPDLGTTVIIFGITILMFFAVPFEDVYKKKLRKAVYFLITGVALIALFMYLSKGELLNEYQMKKFNFLKPCDNYHEVGPGYQVCNGYIALNSSSLFGKGIGNSTQKYLYLPEAHTDFIFPIIVEELGLLVGIALIFMYALILYRILIISKESDNVLGGMISYGVAVFIFLHIFINMVGIFGLLPLTGVPLPFLSYGGSFSLNLFICLGLVQRVAIENNQYKKEEAIRKKIRG